MADLVEFINPNSSSENNPSDQPSSTIISKIHRSEFPEDFIFGAGGSAYQSEGGYMDGNRGPSIWDTFTHRTPAKIRDGSNGNQAINSYHLYKEDVKIMKQAGIEAYRLSISWSRVLPGGRRDAGVNKDGVKFYHDFIDELLANGITPFITLFHWDLPQALEDEYGGFLSPRLVDDFREYAKFCYWEFGDKVKYWITFNEPHSFAYFGYCTGDLAPGRGGKGQEGDPGREPYLVAHHLLLAHKAAVELYRHKFQKCQEGQIGIILNATWMEPLNARLPSDVQAQKRALDFMFGWFLEPLTTGDYPKSMMELVAERLPRFSPEESEILKGCYDFIGINYYTATYVTDSLKPSDPPSYKTDSQVSEIGYKIDKDGKEVPIGEECFGKWQHVVPSGLYKLLVYTKKTYNVPVIYITENGKDEENNTKIVLQEALQDGDRITFIQQHLAKIREAIEEGVNVKGYFIWSLFDDFEWQFGFLCRFGIIHVDYSSFVRTPKDSAIWYKNFIGGKSPTSPPKRPREEEAAGIVEVVKKRRT